MSKFAGVKENHKLKKHHHPVSQNYSGSSRIASSYDFTKLTKNDPSTVFVKEYSERITSTESMLSRYRSQLVEMEAEWRASMQQEKLSKGSIDELLKIYEKKRHLRRTLDKLKQLIENGQREKEKLEKVRNHELEVNYMFQKIGVNPQAAKAKMRTNWIEVDSNPYRDRILSPKYLKALKYGFSLQETSSKAPNPKNASEWLNYDITERKYDIGSILQHQREYKKEHEYRRQVARERRNQYLKEVEHKTLLQKELRNKGIHQKHEAGLYPTSLTDKSMAPFYELRMLTQDRPKLPVIDNRMSLKYKSRFRINFRRGSIESHRRI